MTEAEQRIHDCLDSREGERGWVTLMAPDVRAMLADRDEREAKLRAEVDEALGEIEAFAKENDTLRHQVIACGVAASHPDVNLSRTGAYAGKWNSQQAESVRNLRAERDALALENSLAWANGYKEAYNDVCVSLARRERQGRSRRRGQHWSAIDGIGDTLRADGLDNAIDAALAQIEKEKANGSL